MVAFDKLMAEFSAKNSEVVGMAMARGDTDTAGSALALMALLTGPTGLGRRAAANDWANGLDVVDTGINSMTGRFGAYSSWNGQAKAQFGYMLAFFYLMQATCYSELNQTNRALTSSVPNASAIAEASPLLRTATQEFKAELTQLQSTANSTQSDGCLKKSGAVAGIFLVFALSAVFLAAYCFPRGV